MKTAVIYLSLFALILSGCGEKKESKVEKKELLIYCGITMVKPMVKIKEMFEESNENVKITIVQGGSQDLYNSLKASRKGDLYLPGSPAYRKNNMSDSLLGESALLGHNRATIMVKKGNPLKFSGTIAELATTEHSVAICNPQSGSIGKMSKSILEKSGYLNEVMNNTAFLTTDSRNLTAAIKDGTADITINWRATAFWPENINEVEAIDLPEEVAVKKGLLLNLLNFSTEPELAKKFFDFASSDIGKKVFEEYGF